MMSIYALLDPRDGVCRYVGKTVDVKDRHSSIRKDDRTPRAAWQRSLLKLGLKPTLEVLEEVEGDGSDAERFWIASLRAAGARLLNIADGGEGVLWTPQLRQRVTDQLRGKFPSGARAALEGVWARNRGRKLSESHKVNIATALKGRKFSPETRARISAAMRARSAS